MEKSLHILKRLLEILIRRGKLSRETADYIWNGDKKQTKKKTKK